ncbi:GAF domain-containing protein, partial [Acinetobacter sp. 228]|uniref:GAF domain-containing protein n=1 Tax=Acinetobacter sp. 228 TaxID=3114700 RepID=UPI003A86C3DF
GLIRLKNYYYAFALTDFFVFFVVCRGQQHIRFYAGVPLKDKNGIALGGLCLLDKRPRQMQAEDMILLKALAQDLMATLSNERKKKDKQKQIEQMQPASSASVLKKD